MMPPQPAKIITADVRPAQAEVIRCDKRFRILVAGRRFGKTQAAFYELLKAVCARDRLAWYVAPTYTQAKRIAWKRLKNLARPFRPSIYETDLRMDFPWGSSIALRGADRYDSLRGEGLDFLVLDEYASMQKEAWTEVLRPALADRRGRALFIGTPKGHNHFHELFQYARDQPDWAVFQFTTADGGNVSPDELQAAGRAVDERVYRQEFEASFENLGAGRVYYAFDAQINVAPVAYNHHYGLFWSLDFNVNPMCALVGQIINGNVHVLDEIVLKDSNTLAVCESFFNWVKTQRPVPPIELRVYGDASGQNRHTSASRTDWQMVRDFLDRQGSEFRKSVEVPSVNPPVKDRTNCVNAMLRNHYGQSRLQIDPRCKQLIRDLEQVRWKTDANENPLLELDKSDPMRTHVSDALGYMISYEFPMQAEFGYRRERLF